MNIRKVVYKALHCLYWAIFFFSIITLSLVFCFNLLPKLNEDFIKNGIGAFFGAFFAFIFIIITKWVSARSKQNVDHFNSLVNIERLLSLIISRLDTNIVKYEKHIEILPVADECLWSPNKIPLKYEYSDDVRNIDFVNDYLELCMDIDYLNGDLEMQKTAYDECIALFKEGRVNRENFRLYILRIADEMKKYVEGMKIIQARAYILAAKSRLLTDERKNGWGILFCVRPKEHYDKKIIQKINAEQRDMTASISKNRSRRQEDIRTFAPVISILDNLRHKAKNPTSES